MSNNKSRHLARKAGSHLVGVPTRPETRFEDIDEHRAFIRKISGKRSAEEVIAQFTFILKRYKTNSELLIRISAVTGIDPASLRRSLDTYARLYTSPGELWELFGEKQW